MMNYCERSQDMYRAILTKKPGEMEGMLQDACYDLSYSLDRSAQIPDALLSNIIRVQSAAPKESVIPNSLSDFH